MKIDKKTIAFLKGKEFSDGYFFSIKDLFYSNTRIEKILELTKDKKILHLGCCDHIPLIEKRIVENKWLHKLLFPTS